ncbi:MAG: NADH oxidoreductase (quinone) subunit F [Nitrospiraceae bacterium]|nr:MAG: NADH oxidoreductase (quinone) subunit F [Nitrospiraceae bacterium]
MKKKPLTKNIRPGRGPLTLKEYEKSGGYQAVRKALKMTPQQVQEEVKASNLRGRGGAGFPTGMKWSFVPMGDDAPRPKYFLVNADEMEPGAFKDRLLLEGDPHQVIEGAIVSSYAIQADIAYIFLRWAYKLAEERLARAIAEAYAENYLGKNIMGSDYSLELYLHVSAGRYICGEETALLNAMEGRRAIPRTKPPFPQVCGLWGKPSVVNNTETVCNVPHIISNGAEWFKGLGRSGDGGTKIYGVSGRVNRPGAWELPMGTTIRELLEEHAGGMIDGYKFRGVMPGGGSTDFLVGEHLDVKMDFDSVQKAGSRMGTGTMIVLDDKTCPVGMVHNLEEFFARESCGWCTPCREGLPWLAKILRAIEEGKGEAGDIEILKEHTKLLGPGNTFCAHAPGAVEPLQSALKYFREDFERHIREKRCSYK